MNCRIYLRGEIDIASVSNLQSDLDRASSASSAHLILDCTYLSYIDSSAVEVLVNLRDALADQKRRVQLVNVPRAHRRLLELLGLTDLLGDDHELSA